MKISPFTPLFFIDRRTDGIESDYLQVFSTEDEILAEVISEPNQAPVFWLDDMAGGTGARRINTRSQRMNNGTSVYWAYLMPGEGIWSLRIDGIGSSEPFLVTSSEAELADTAVIRYTMKDNRQRTDALFLTVNDDQLVFTFRVHGGFKDADWSFSAQSEQYSDDYANIEQLWGLESTQKRFTLGPSSGVPVWYAELLNRILVCSYVFIDGVQYMRKDTNVPEIEQPMEGVNSFVFRQTLQQAVNISEEDTESFIALRRIDGNEDYRDTENDGQRIIVT